MVETPIHLEFGCNSMNRHTKSNDKVKKKYQLEMEIQNKNKILTHDNTSNRKILIYIMSNTG